MLDSILPDIESHSKVALTGLFCILGHTNPGLRTLGYHTVSRGDEEELMSATGARASTALFMSSISAFHPGWSEFPRDDQRQGF